MMTLKWMTILAVGLLAVQASAEEAPALKTQKDKGELCHWGQHRKKHETRWDRD